MTDADPIPLDHQLCFSVYGAAIAINRLYKPMLDELGLTYPQYLVLSALWEAGPLTVGGIADRLDLESSTVTPPVKRLEQAGLVVRDRDRADERKVIVRLTDAGHALRRPSACLTETLLARSGLTVEDLVALNRQVQMLRDAVSRAD
ncbi:MAG: MarR family transcriptional regulator [Amaricoccus sp.]